jgi:hypothetical protein
MQDDTSIGHRALRGGWFLAVALLLMPAATAGAASAASPIGPAAPSVTAPYRFNPPPQPLTPLEQQKALQYRSQLQERVFDFDRAPDPLRAMQEDELRRARREVDRMNQMLLPH